MAHSASVRARALALVLEGGLHFRQAAERLAVELGDGAPHARTIARWVDAEIGAGRAVLPPWVYRRRGEAVVEEAMGMLRAGCPVSEVVETMGVSDGSVRRWAHERGVEVIVSCRCGGCRGVRLGGAYIDSIEGDPSGIIGLSLPLARELVQELGIDWTDLWNVARDEQFPQPLSSVKALPPKENVHQPGDGWVDCACGRKHWGTNGAAGVLLARRDPESGEVTHIVMQHRAAWSAEGGTWGIPGGAIADGESPIEGALREAYEEANITPADIEVVGSYCEDHGPWAYTTVFAFEKPGHEVHPRANDDESMEIEWVPITEVPNLKLLTAMRADWPRFEKRLNEVASTYKGR